MSAKKQKKSDITRGRTKPFLSFTWVLVLFLLLFIFCIILISDTNKTQLPKEAEKVKNMQTKMFNVAQYQDAAVNELKTIAKDENTVPKIISTEPVQWPDASLGCPQKGMMYAQVITPGYKIHIELNGKEYIYHAGLEKVVFCDS